MIMSGRTGPNCTAKKTCEDKMQLHMTKLPPLSYGTYSVWAWESLGKHSWLQCWAGQGKVVWDGCRPHQRIVVRPQTRLSHWQVSWMVALKNKMSSMSALYNTNTTTHSSLQLNKQILKTCDGDMVMC